MFHRVGKNNKEIAEIINLSEKPLTDDELESVVEEYVESNTVILNPKAAFEIKKEEYKREKARDGFEAGSGGFKRSQ